MTAPLAVDKETANEIVNLFAWGSNVMRDGRLINQRDVVAEAIAQALTEVRTYYEEVLADKRRLTRELDVAMHGEEGAAKQANLCDLIEPARKLRGGVESMNPLEVTEWLLRQPLPTTRGLVVNMPAGGMSLHARLFQARMWREYAMTWHGRATRSGVDQRWCEQIGRMTYAGCVRRARVNLYLARRLNRARL